MAKIDIEAAYRVIPARTQDHPLQAVEWEGNIYVDPILPLGLCTAPKFFNAVADALTWHLRRHGIRYILHYLDDFIVTGCQETVAILCRQLGLPIAEHKRDGPTIYLGIIIDSMAGELRLQDDKLRRLQALLGRLGDSDVEVLKKTFSLMLRPPWIIHEQCYITEDSRSSCPVPTGKIDMSLATTLARWQGWVAHSCDACSTYMYCTVPTTMHARRDHQIRLNTEF